MDEQVAPDFSGVGRSEAAALWTVDHVRSITLARPHIAPLIEDGDFSRVSEDMDIWDAWPVQGEDGYPVRMTEGVTLWMALAAPRFPDPEERHAHARLHLFERREASLRHMGPVMPDGFSPGSREWSGSAVLAPDGKALTLYFTATGIRGEAVPSFGQRLFEARAVVEQAAGGYRCTGWHSPREIVARDPVYYMATEGAAGRPGTIKAFRDPAYFCDPDSGVHFLFFAGSLAGSPSQFNGVVGVATTKNPAAGEWKLLPPIVSADGLNNELERPHVVHHCGRYYLFWSTQAHVFAPEGPCGPTGLYGMVSDRPNSGWRPLNGTGLVFANPPEAPSQAYSWLVLPDLSVISFVDDWGTERAARSRRFGGTFAPELHLSLDDDSARLVD